MNPETQTPRTDAIAHRGYNESAYIAEMTGLARQLERELDFSEQTGRQIWQANERLKAELATKDAHADEIYKAAVDLAAKLERDLEQERQDRKQAEAERLAEKHSGRAFEILKCVGHSSTSKAITFWMDGEGPPHPLGANASGLARDEAEETPEKPRYRMLDEGESIEDGDEFSRGFHWMPSQCAGQKYTKVMHQPHRRPL